MTAPQQLEANYDRPKYLEASNKRQIIYSQILEASYYLEANCTMDTNKFRGMF
jgi:hypothetical protein